MVVMTVQDLVKDGKVIATLRVYVSGTGNPADKHEMWGFSIDGNHWGGDEAPHADKIEELGPVNL